MPARRRPSPATARRPTRSRCSTSPTATCSSGASFSPSVLAGLSQAQIAGDLTSPASPLTQAVVAVGQRDHRHHLRGRRRHVPARSARAGACWRPTQAVCRIPAPRLRSANGGGGSAGPAVEHASCARPRSCHPRCRAARGSGWRSRGTRPARGTGRRSPWPGSHERPSLPCARRATAERTPQPAVPGRLPSTATSLIPGASITPR